MERVTQKRYPGQFSNVFTDHLHLIYKISIETTGLKLSNVKLDGLASDLGIS